MLPKIDSPLFEMKIPSQDRLVKFRPFLVKEEKLLLIAQETGTDKAIMTAVKQILNNCIVDRFNVDDLTTFDMEYMFIQLRAKSVNNIIEVSMRDTEDDKLYTFEINLDDVEVIIPDNVEKKIKINDTVGIVMKYPSINLLTDYEDNFSKAEFIEYLLVNCIETIYDAENVYPISDQSKDDIEEFLDSLSIPAYDKIKDFFSNLPKIEYVITYTNELGNERKVVFNNLKDFFTWG
jgi:hypothetical protein